MHRESLLPPALATQTRMPSAISPSMLASLPPPQTFDIIPPLSRLLSRLLTNPLDPNVQPSLSPKDLATEVATIKLKIQKARTAVEGLPDIDRTIEEQEAEIRELKGRIRLLRSIRSEIVQAGHTAAGS